jgi:UDP-N-acetylmuramoylalanine--D-glutamate ligase
MTPSLSRVPAGGLVAVIGLGASGVAAAELLLARGFAVLLNDRAPEDRLSDEARALLAHPRVTAVFGTHVGLPFPRLALVVVSPGVPSFPALQNYEDHGGQIIGELELAWEALAGVPTAAIGGTNGKSTTTELVAAMLLAAKKRTFVCGNLGTPLATIAPRTAEEKSADVPFDAVVLEVSSFQAERMKTFQPKVGALLNITADHLDRYPGFAAYAAAKGRMFAAMTEDDIAIVPAGDSACLREAERGEAHIVTFGGDGDLAVTPDAFVDKLRGHRYLRSEFQLSGGHNANNAAAAIAIASSMGADPEAIRTALREFKGLPHRMVLVETVNGVRYYDDSKGTNVGAAVTALLNLEEPRAVLIAGGRDKRGGYADLVNALAEKGRAVVAIGEAAGAIVAAAKDVVPAFRVATMEEAVQKAQSLAQDGDAVLLSPACSSYDMFRDYKHRGEVFAAAVQTLEGSRAARPVTPKAVEETPAEKKAEASVEPKAATKSAAPKKAAAKKPAKVEGAEKAPAEKKATPAKKASATASKTTAAAKKDPATTAKKATAKKTSKAAET